MSCEIGAGEMVAVTGHSGAGKSTLLKLAAGIERATRGTVVVNGQNLAALGETALAVLRRRIGFVFQDHKLLFDRSACDNVALPLRIAGFARDEAGRRVRAALDKVGLLGAREGDAGRALRRRAAAAVHRARHREPARRSSSPTSPPATSTPTTRARSSTSSSPSTSVGVTVLLSTHDEASLARLGGRRIALAQRRAGRLGA